MLDWVSLLVGVMLTALRSRQALVVENLLLRQQLAVALRARRRPRVRWPDRLFWVVARRLVTDWRRHLMLVQPETVLRWHRQGRRLSWWWRSRRPTGRPRLTQEVRDLILRLSEENRLWGTERIRGELLKLGIAIGNGSIRRSRWRRAPRPPGQAWGTFLRNHAPCPAIAVAPPTGPMRRPSARPGPAPAVTLVVTPPTAPANSSTRAPATRDSRYS